MKSLVEQMYVYASYHRHPRNRAFHLVGVPMITFSILIPMAWARLPVAGFEVSLAMVFVAAVLLYYFFLDVPLAIGMVVVILPLLWLAEWAAGLGYATGGIVFGATFVVGWIIQLVGHHFEGRKPALVDNLFQVFVSPIFLLAEVAFMLGLKKQVHAEVERLIAERGLYGVSNKPRALAG